MQYALWISRPDGCQLNFAWSDPGRILDFLALHDQPGSILRLEVYADAEQDTPTHTYEHPETIYHVLSEGHLRRGNPVWLPVASPPPFWLRMKRFMVKLAHR